MIIRITCACNAAFENKNGNRHPDIVTCPNCGRSLPDNATNDLFTALNSFSLFEAKLDNSGLYEIEILK